MSDSAIQEHPARFEAETSVVARGGARAPAHHDRGLLLIGLFKLGKSAFFVGVGIGAIHLLHKDLGDVAMRLAMIFHQDPEGRVVSLLVQKVDLIDAARLREAGLFSIAYAALALTEGVGLMLEKVWAEYLTLCLTISFLPWELYELVKSADVTRLFLLVANLVVLAYIVWFLRRKKKQAA
jgi:uncharacterized membrane protein (DUF2068 family)